jgi:ABC-2 type transport system ATP-binding protein
VFLTTQYLEEVDRLCDRLAIIQDGEIVAADSPDTLKRAVGGDILELTLADPATEADRAARIARRSDTLDDARVEATDTGVTVTSGQAREAVSDLFVSFHEADITVTGFDVRSPTLDEVFFSLTGESPDGSDRDTQQTLATTQEVAQ